MPDGILIVSSAPQVRYLFNSEGGKIVGGIIGAGVDAACDAVSEGLCTPADAAIEVGSQQGGSAIEDYLAGVGGRLGGALTRFLNNDIATNLEDLGYNVTNGAGRGPEEYIPGPGGGVSGSTYVDITATDGTSTIRVQSITTLADGFTPTPGEAAAAARIQLNFPNDQLLLVPK